jgi:hypothetical protein
MNQPNETKRYQGQRGPGVKPALVHTNVRLPPEVYAYYKSFPSPTVKMREVLTAHTKK